MDNNKYSAMVEKIIPVGQHGPYAIARSEQIGSITFSLDPEVWKEKKWPEPGTYVIVQEVIRKRAGWRANSGRFMYPSDTIHNSTS